VTKPADPLAPLRSRSYLALLALAAIIGVPVSAAAFGFLALVNKLQGWIFTSLPRGLGLHATPVWWPIPLLVISGVLVALAIRYLPGSGGHCRPTGSRRAARRRRASCPASCSLPWPACASGSCWGPRRR
jgi:hypothetical protein